LIDSLIEKHTQGTLTRADAEYAAKSIFDIGFKEGQSYVWFMRSGFGQRDETESTPSTITISGGSEGASVWIDAQTGKTVE
jgi:hypothetical protein